MNKIKAAIASALVAAGSLPVWAEGGSLTLDMTGANNAADAIGTGISGLITGKVLTNVLLVVGAALAIWAVFLVVRWMKKGAK